MRKVYLILILFSSLLIAQETSSDSTTTNASVSDSVNIRSLVQEQIQKALQNQTESVITSASNVQPEEKTTTTVNPEEQSSNTGIVASMIFGQPIQYIIFELGSLLIVGFIVLRRIIQSIQKKSLNAFKAKISLLRNEKVLAKQDPKLQMVRKQLSNNDSIFNKSEKHISKRARELKISKGEFLLAARLRLFDVGKM